MATGPESVVLIVFPRTTVLHFVVASKENNPLALALALARPFRSGNSIQRWRQDQKVKLA